MSLRLAFMGTPEFAVPALRALLESGHQVVAVYTQPPRPKGRGHQVTKSSVHQVAEAAGVPVFTPTSLKGEAAQAEFRAHNLDLAIVAAYGLILPPAILAAPRLGCVNIHGSLLPRWRGAAPIQRALLAGDTETGICLMQMEAGLDTGPVYASASLPITATTTASSLHDDLAALGARLLREKLPVLAEGKLPPVPQPEEGVTYAAKLTKEEGRLNWSRPAVELDRQIRALNPWPGTECVCAGEPLKILSASLQSGQGDPGTILDDRFTVACGEGALRLERVQRPGRGPVSGAEGLRGLHLAPGVLLSAA